MYKSNIREEFHKLIDEFDDTNLLEEFYDILNSYYPQDPDKDILDELSDTQKDRLQESKAQSKGGQTISHDKVKSQFRK